MRSPALPRTLSFALLLCLGTTATAPATGRDRANSMAALTASWRICHVEVPDPAGVPETLAGWAKGAQMFPGLGNRTRKISTNSPQAQAYFDQGMAWLWAFNHDEATRSFAKAASIDPHCAICFWGAALTIGPNYNLGTMTGPRARVAYDAIRTAQSLAKQASPVEQALIAALAARYPSSDAIDDKSFPLRQGAYAEAMRKAAAAYPADLDIQTLTAEALMTEHAWQLWGHDGKPAAGTLDVVARLEAVLKADPHHPGAAHYYVHAMEASPHPERAVAAAEALIGAMPGAGHLEHMPSHIFQRVGRYEDSAEANRRGTAADLAYYKRVAPLDYYGGYTTHNLQFLALGAAMEGRYEEAMHAMNAARASLGADIEADSGLAWLQGQRYAYEIRYGHFDAMLAEAAPPAKLKSLQIAYLWGMGTAQAATGQLGAAIASLGRLDAAITAMGNKANGLQTGPAQFTLLAHLLRARIAQASNQTDTELAELHKAVADEDSLNYDEPPDCFTPTRQALGAALLRAGRPAEAEAVYHEDLRRTPENGFSLLGLAQALAAQGKPHGDITRRFEKAWAHATERIGASSI